jgi:hypothetical protein
MTDPKTGKQYYKIAKMIKKYKCWEAMPNRQSPLTKNMFEDKQAQTKDWHHDCKDKKAFVNDTNGNQVGWVERKLRRSLQLSWTPCALSMHISSCIFKWKC